MKYSIILLAMGLVLGADQAAACMPSTTQLDEVQQAEADGKAIKNATAVFVGTVIKTEEGPKIEYTDTSGERRSYPDGMLYTFKIERAWKGIEKDTVVVHGSTNSGDCSGQVLNVGTRYMVFAEKDHSWLKMSPFAYLFNLTDSEYSKPSKVIMDKLGEPTIRFSK